MINISAMSTTTSGVTSQSVSAMPSMSVQTMAANVMYEGSHIHFSPIDNKPLCSYSAKLCKQRRINGYAFCIRHILEDKSAPFKQCSHVAKYNQQKCSNAIPGNEDRQFCNSHMQIAGMAPKKERKDKKGANKVNNNRDITANVNDICNNIVNNFVNGVNEKLANGNAAKGVKMNGSVKKLDKCGNTSTISSTTATSMSCYMTDSLFCNNSNNNKSVVNSNNSNANKKDIKKAKRKKKCDDKTSIEKFVFARKKTNSEHLFSYNIWSSSSDDECSDDNENSVNNDDNYLPPVFTSLRQRIDELEANELKNELTAQKLLLKNLIYVRQKDLQKELQKTRSLISSLQKSLNSGYSYLDLKLRESARRSHSSIRKGICCYKSDERSCNRPSLPYTRHCMDHILYNVDQLIFSRCRAKSAQTLTHCTQSTFDIINDEPLCDYHKRLPQESESTFTTLDGKSIKRRKKTKPMALTRVNRRAKKRRKTISESVNSMEENSFDKTLSEDTLNDETSDEMSVLPSHQTSNIDTTDHIDSSIPQTHRSPELPLMSSSLLRIPSMSTRVTASPVMLENNVMPPPPPLEAGDEALVASIVADLPHLSNDGVDFSEVLNKIPLSDDAFSDFLLDHPNGETPSTEETEALEQALALVNKDVQNLFAFAGMNGSSQMSDPNGQSEILGFSNWLGSLTTEQRHQLNGLIDGAIASNSLSPILKNSPTFPTPMMSQSNGSPILKCGTSNAFSNVYQTHNQSLSMPSTSQEFVQMSTNVSLMNNNLLMNGLSSHHS